VKKLGLISGTGELPLAIASEARSKGYCVVAIGLEPLAHESLSSVVDEITWVHVGKLGEIINTLKKSGCKEVVMAGKVPKTLLYKGNVTPDLRAVKVMFSLKDRSDDAILLAISRELEKDGITLRNTTDFSTELLTPEGVLTVVVKDRAVMAVEAIEGTDEAILRGGELAGKGAVVIKVSKPEQDMRFDVPVVGTDTLEAMIKIHARVLAVEAEKSILMDRENMLHKAAKAGISVVGYSAA
jgi:DUF1009 family protein